MLKPGVSKETLLLVAGVVWVCVGVCLITVAVTWLLASASGSPATYLAGGGFLALLMYQFGLLRIVDKNVARIMPMEGRRCAFSFIPWKSYVVILLMVVMGALLRRSSIPKHYLSVPYSGMGLALILSSVRYMRILLRERKRRD